MSNFVTLNRSNILFERKLFHLCLKSFYWSLHCDKKWGAQKHESLGVKKSGGLEPSSLIEVYDYVCGASYVFLLSVESVTDETSALIPTKFC